MKRILLFPVFLAACAAQPGDDPQYAAAVRELVGACQTIGSSLVMAATLNNAGQLTPEQVALVDAADQVARPPCTNPVTPTRTDEIDAALRVVRGVIDQLYPITGVKEP